ncbi:hypothetical protein VP01_139g3 [Puccinia sorghi]|uniref:Uncharacterized protein n=1 Tax=Puccinia sorghi TaxID=27349 RepID=A0A0L6VLK4_9BASI|nr:hypothetical protein VP01_139g3 [Puccinia sorghi]
MSHTDPRMFCHGGRLRMDVEGCEYEARGAPARKLRTMAKCEIDKFGLLTAGWLGWSAGAVTAASSTCHRSDHVHPGWLRMRISLVAEIGWNLDSTPLAEKCWAIGLRFIERFGGDSNCIILIPNPYGKTSFSRAHMRNSTAPNVPSTPSDYRVMTCSFWQRWSSETSPHADIKVYFFFYVRRYMSFGEVCDLPILPSNLVKDTCEAYSSCLALVTGDSRSDLRSRWDVLPRTRRNEINKIRGHQPNSTMASRSREVSDLLSPPVGVESGMLTSWWKWEWEWVGWVVEVWLWEFIWERKGSRSVLDGALQLLNDQMTWGAILIAAERPLFIAVGGTLWGLPGWGALVLFFFFYFYFICICCCARTNNSSPDDFYPSVLSHSKGFSILTAIAYDSLLLAPCLQWPSNAYEERALLRDESQHYCASTTYGLIELDLRRPFYRGLDLQWCTPYGQGYVWLVYSGKYHGASRKSNENTLEPLKLRLFRLQEPQRSEPGDAVEVFCGFFGLIDCFAVMRSFCYPGTLRLLVLALPSRSPMIIYFGQVPTFYNGAPVPTRSLKSSWSGFANPCLCPMVGQRSNLVSHCILTLWGLGLRDLFNGSIHSRKPQSASGTLSEGRGCEPMERLRRYRSNERGEDKNKPASTLSLSWIVFSLLRPLVRPNRQSVYRPTHGTLMFLGRAKERLPRYWREQKLVGILGLSTSSNFPSLPSAGCKAHHFCFTEATKLQENCEALFFHDRPRHLDRIGAFFQFLFSLKNEDQC